MKELQDQLFQEHSKPNTELIAKRIVNKDYSLSLLIEIIDQNQEPLSARAAWVITSIAKKHPILFLNYIPLFTQWLGGNYHDAVKRAVWRYFAFHLPLHYSGELFELGFNQLISKKSSIGIKIWILDVLFKLTLQYPELKDELVYAIEGQILDSTSGFKNKGNKILKKLKP